MSTWKKNVSQRLHLLPPYSHGLWPLTGCWANSMAVQALVWPCCCPPFPELHDSLGTGIKSSSESWVKTESSPGRTMDSLLLGIFQKRLKIIIKGSFTAGEAASLVHTCRSSGSWASVPPGLWSKHSTCVTEQARGFSSIPVAQGFQQLLTLLSKEFYL